MILESCPTVVMLDLVFKTNNVGLNNSDNECEGIGPALKVLKTKFYTKKNFNKGVGVYLFDTSFFSSKLFKCLQKYLREKMYTYDQQCYSIFPAEIQNKP